MAIDIPTPFDLLTTRDWENSYIGDAAAAVKLSGGLQLDEDAVQWYANDTSADEGLRYNFNATPSAVDMTDELFILSWTFNAQNRIEIAPRSEGGQKFWLYTTDTTNYKAWNIGGEDTARAQFYSNTHKPLVVDPASTAHSSAGTFDKSSVIFYGFSILFKDIAGASSYSWAYVSRAVRMGTAKSSTNIPRLYASGVKMKDLYSYVMNTDYTNVRHNYVEKLGDAYFLACPFVIGKSGESTSFDDEGITVLSPASDDHTDPRFQLTNNSMRVYLDLQPGDTVTFSGSYIWGTRAPFDFDTTETVTFNTPTFQGMGTITIGSGISGPANFVNTDILLNKADTWDLDGSTFNTPGDAQQLMEIG